MSNLDAGMFINPDSKVSPAILAGLLSRNVSLVYQWGQSGRLPSPLIDYTYRECLNHLLGSLLRAEEAKGSRYKANNRNRVNLTVEGDDDSDGLHPLVAAKLKQNIKTEIAREADLWQKIAIKRGEYVAFGDKLDLVEGVVLSIRDTLLHIGNNYPDIQGRVDEAMEELYQLGKLLVEEADVDADNYIDTMLAKDIGTIDV